MSGDGGFDDDDAPFRVVINDEEQYSIWWVDRDIPAGWRAEGFEGTRRDCIEYVDRVWKDITPLSVRRALAERRERQGNA